MAIDEKVRNQFRIPGFCPFCGWMMKGKSTQTYLKYGVCIMCTIQFIEDREDRWNSGWRPNDEELEQALKART